MAKIALLAALNATIQHAHASSVSNIEERAKIAIGEATAAPLHAPHGRALSTEYKVECPPFIYEEGDVRCNHAFGKFHMLYLNGDPNNAAFEFTATGQEPKQGQRTVVDGEMKTVTQNYKIWYNRANKEELCQVTGCALTSPC